MTMWSNQPITEMSVSHFLGVESVRHVRLATSQPSENRFFRKCTILDISQTFALLRHLGGIISAIFSSWNQFYPMIRGLVGLRADVDAVVKIHLLHLVWIQPRILIRAAYSPSLHWLSYSSSVGRAAFRWVSIYRSLIRRNRNPFLWQFQDDLFPILSPDSREQAIIDGVTFAMQILLCSSAAVSSFVLSVSTLNLPSNLYSLFFCSPLSLWTRLPPTVSDGREDSRIRNHFCSHWGTAPIILRH